MNTFLKKMLVVCAASIVSAIGSGIGEALSDEILDRWEPLKNKSKKRKPKKK